MAKKETLAKRARKVRKEEHLVLGGRGAKAPRPRRNADSSAGPKTPRKRISSGEGDSGFKPRESKSGEGENRRFERRDGAKPSFRTSRSGDGERRPFEKRDGSKAPFKARSAADGDKRPFQKRDSSRPPYKSGRSADGESRPPFKTGRGTDGDKRPYQKRDGERRPFTKRDGAEAPVQFTITRDGQESNEPWKRKPRSFDKNKLANAAPSERQRDSSDGDHSGSAPREPRTRQSGSYEPRTGNSGFRADRTEGRAPRKFEGRDKNDRFKSGDKFSSRGGFKPRRTSDERPPRFEGTGSQQSHSKFLKDKHFDGFAERGTEKTDLVRLNKYLSVAGICSRREADAFIEQGLVTVNGVVVTALGTKVKPTDEVKYAGERVKAEALRYILLNKPKDVITTLSDDKGRSTVMALVRNACHERVFPVGRLDRNTTGLLLLTNDGDLAKKLTHPSHQIRKVYHVITDKNVSQADLKKLESGVELEDGLAQADAALYAGDGSVRNEIGLEIHSGKNRVVRRMFEALGYEVTRLDRAAFAGLSKKGLPRGRWRFLTEKEVSYLKML